MKNNNNNNQQTNKGKTESISGIQDKLRDTDRRSQIDDNNAISHIGEQRWKIISTQYPVDNNIWRALFEQGKNAGSKNSHSISKSCCGEILYLQMRPELAKRGLVFDEKISEHDENKNKNPKKKNDKKKPSKKKESGKAEKIKQGNLLQNIKGELSEIDEFTKQKKPQLGKLINFSAKFFEIIMVKMMSHCEQLLRALQNNKKKLEQQNSFSYPDKKEIEKANNNIEIYTNEINEMIVGYHKIINDNKSDPNLSPTCIKDLEYWIERAKKSINFDPSYIIISNPEMIFKTKYDGMLGQKRISMFPSQEQIFSFATTNKSYLGLVHTMLGSGKTTMVPILTGWLMNQSDKSNTKILYCCPNEAVLLEVANMVYSLGIPFGIVIRNKKDGKLNYKWSVFTDTGRQIKKKRQGKDFTVQVKGAISSVDNEKVKLSDTIDSHGKQSAVLYICDIYVARRLLEERHELIVQKEQYIDYILVGDELTKDADTKIGHGLDTGFSVPTEVFIDLMKLAPPRIILMSATLPTYEQLSEFYNKIISCHKGMIIKSFASSEAKIGCAIVSKSGALYAPHLGSNTIADIERVLSIIRTNPFVGRFYTFEVLLRMVDVFKKIGLETPDLTVMFNDPSKATQNNIQKTAYEMLEKLIEKKSDPLVKEVCQLCSSENNREQIRTGVNLDTILTKDFGRFNKGTIVFCTDPVTTAIRTYRTNFEKPNSDRSIFDEIKLDQILDKYNKEVQLYKRAIDRIENKKDSSVSKQNKDTGKKEKMTSSWERASNVENNRPQWIFPPELQLCSVEHLKYTKCDTNPASMNTIQPEDLPEDSNVSTEIMTLLASGIGIYSVSNPLLDDIYLKTVLMLAKKGLLKIIFADGSIAYGTNLAVSDIVIVDEPGPAFGKDMAHSIIDLHSIKTIFQMLGRAGRGGNLSYEARVYTTSDKDNLIHVIHNYIHGNLDEGPKDEVKNIDLAFRTCW